MRTRTSR